MRVSVSLDGIETYSSDKIEALRSEDAISASKKVLSQYVEKASTWPERPSRCVSTADPIDSSQVGAHDISRAQSVCPI